MQNRKTRLSLLISAGIITLAGCSSTANTQAKIDELKEKEEQLQSREATLAKREAEVANQVAAINTQSQTQENAVKNDEELLPPNASAGECYARIWVEPKYKQVEKQVLVKSESESLETIPASYQTVQEKILISPAASKIVPTAARYETRSEKVLVSDATRSWHVEPRSSAAPASDGVIATAKKYGIDIDNAKPNVCYHEHYLAPKFENVNEQVLVSDASETIVPIPASYRTVEKQILVKEASSRVETVPAVYETVGEQVIDKPAHQVWKKGTGAIQKIDESTGEIMCLVDVPATYRTVYKQVLKTPATSRTVEIPAVYETVKVQELVTPASETRTAVPAKYTNVSKKKQVSDGQYIWHEVHDKSLPASTRTGNKICLVEQPAQYKTVQKRVLVQPAGFETVAIPAQYKNVNVQKLVKAADVKRTVIPAQYKTVSQDEMIAKGFMEWRSILCETNMTRSRIGDIQRALETRGYNPGRIDGVIGKDTMAAVNLFQKDNSLPVDKYLNIATVKALGVAPK
ncbi:hypothetical protein CS022_23815 [Veronia nyctiphanis]|uniref:Peptidoglycan binding-like domain-containing protein n=1 Tax=Veronia nyctiphanis TaxID=1278244 RepID=A0A4Q0YKD0_9GAMM|nr:peptidoglycan-binding domain-containing protein [Veronia nyctiphanis]RXJ69471.1 hypothetical protein CS022_23815 [Veronia nyctiphanis]